MSVRGRRLCKDAFFLVVDHANMDKILREDVREQFLIKGMEVQFPPEHAATRAVLLKNVDSSIIQMTELEIAINITPQLLMEKVVKISGSSHLLKIIYLILESADMAINQWINVLFKKFSGNSIEKEVFMSVVPCCRCYSYKHQKKSCTKPQNLQNMFKLCE